MKGCWQRIFLEKRGHSRHTRYQLSLWIILQHALNQTRPVQVLDKCILFKNHSVFWQLIARTFPALCSQIYLYMLFFFQLQYYHV